MVPPVALKLLPYILAAAAALGAYWYVSSLRSDLAEAKTKVTELEGKFNRSQDDLKQATVARDAYLDQLSNAEQMRRKVQADLQGALLKLRSQKPPVECKAAIDWAVDQKLDLDWSKK